MTVSPQIELGNIQTGQRGDASFEAYNKFNIHEHNVAYSGDFLSLGILPGYKVTALYLDVELFTNVTVISISNTQIELSNFPLVVALNVDVVFAHPFTGKPVILKGLNLTPTSLIINNSSVPLTGGQLTINQVKSINTLMFSGVLPFTNVGTIFSLIIKNQKRFYITKLHLICQGGNVNISLINNSTTLIASSSLLNNAITEVDKSKQTNTESSLIDINDHLKLTILSATGTPFINYNLYGVVA